MNLPPVGFAALWHPELAVAAILLGIVYHQVTASLRSRFPEGERPAPAQATAFLTGLLVLYIAQGTPLELLSNRYLFSAHMLQMVLFVFVAPPLLMIGTPVWLWRPLFTNLPLLRRVVHWMTRPLRIGLLFLLVFSIYLTPQMTETALGNSWLYLLEHVVTVLAAIFMWWPILEPVPEIPGLSELGQLLYMFLVELGMTMVFALITFAGAPIYSTFAHASRVTSLGVMDDQALGGIVMRLGSMCTFGVMLVQRFYRWAHREAQRTDLPTPDDDLAVPRGPAAVSPAPPGPGGAAVPAAAAAPAVPGLPATPAVPALPAAPSLPVLPAAPGGEAP